jgi:hypothetical protein
MTLVVYEEIFMFGLTNTKHDKKPSKMIEVDFKIAHHSIFTNTKLMKMITLTITLTQRTY